MNENKDIKRIHAAAADIISGAQPTIEKQTAFANDTKRLFVHEVGGAFSQFPNSTEVILKTGAVTFTGDQSHGGYGITGIRDAAFLDTDTLTIDHATGRWDITSSVDLRLTATEISFVDSDFSANALSFYRSSATDWTLGTGVALRINADDIVFIDTDQAALLTLANNSNTEWSFTTTIAQKFVATSFIFDDSDYANNLTINQANANRWEISTDNLVSLKFIATSFIFEDNDNAAGDLVFHKLDADTWEIGSDTTQKLTLAMNNIRISPVAYDDWRWGGSPHDPPGGYSPATVTEIASTDTFAWTFTDGKMMAFMDLQLPHDYKEGTDIPLHIHWTPTTTATYYGVWQLEITGWVSAAAGTALTTVSRTAAFNSSVTAYQMQTTDFSSGLSGTGRKISSIITASLYLILYTGTSCMLLGLDGHYEKDSFGSASATVKD